MQAKAAKLGRPGSGAAEDDAGKGDGILPVGKKAVQVQGDRGTSRRQPQGGKFAVVERPVVFPAAAGGRFMTRKDDAGTRVPAPELPWLLGVVREEEIFYRVLLARGTPGKVGVGIAADALLVGFLFRPPFVRRQDPKRIPR